MCNIKKYFDKLKKNRKVNVNSTKARMTYLN